MAAGRQKPLSAKWSPSRQQCSEKVTTQWGQQQCCCLPAGNATQPAWSISHQDLTASRVSSPPPNPDGGKSKSKHGQTPMAPGNTTPASKSLPESTRNSCAQKVSCYSNAQHVNAASHPKTKLRCAPLSRPFATQHCHHKPALRQQLPHRSPRSCGTGHLFATLSHRHRHTR